MEAIGELKIEGKFEDDISTWLESQLEDDRIENMFNSNFNAKDEVEDRWLVGFMESVIKMFLEDKGIYADTFRTKHGWESEIMQKDELVSATKGAKGSSRKTNVVINLNNLVSMYNSNYFD